MKRYLKRALAGLLAVTLIFPVQLEPSFGTGRTGGTNLPSPSGQTVLDTDPAGGYEGDFVLIYNSSDDKRRSESTGTLNSLKAPVSSRMKNVEEMNWLDYHPDYDGKVDRRAYRRSASSVSYREGDLREFEITSPQTDASRTIEFEVLYQGSNCYVWAPKGTSAGSGSGELSHLATAAMAEQAGREFDGFYEEMTRNFGDPYDADRSGKVSILMYDIQCGNNPSGYIAGFFDRGELLNGNESIASLHIDTYPSIYSPYGYGEPQVSNCYSTMVHEFQHLLNFSSALEKSGLGSSPVEEMELWLNEAMSMAAEEMIFPESSLPSRRSYYERDYYNDLKNGQSLLDFNNSLDSYALSALFSAYLKNQTGGYEVFSRILEEFDGDEAEAIQSAIRGSELDGMSFSDMACAYRIALAGNDKRGIYGFLGDPLMEGIRPLVYSKNNTSVMLQGGGSILIAPEGGVFVPGSGAGSDIRFVGIRQVADGVEIVGMPQDKKMVVGTVFNGSTATALIDGRVEPVTWSSSDPGKAAIDRDGTTLEALMPGNTVITAEAGGYKDQYTLAVEEPSIRIEGKTETLLEGEELRVKAVYGDSNDTVVWDSTALGIATIDPDPGNSDIGIIKGLSEGSTTISAVLASTASGSAPVVDTFLLKVVPRAQAADYTGLDIDSADKIIHVRSAEGMENLAKIVNDPVKAPPDMGDGLKDWRVYLDANVELDQWTPIGINANSFKGTFWGTDHKITIKNTKNDQLYSGLFGRNAGILYDVNLTVTGTITTADRSGSAFAGGVAGQNDETGKIYNPIVNVDETGKIDIAHTELPGNSPRHQSGGIVGRNDGYIENAQVTNNGNIGSGNCNSSGGVAGTNQGPGYPGRGAILSGAVVYNNGTIESGDDTGAVIGLHHDNGNANALPLLTGKVSVVITESGDVTSTDVSTLSVGGAVGYAAFGARFENMQLDIRIDGTVAANRNYGCAGGVIGQVSQMSTFGSNISMAVTLGPEARMPSNAPRFGLLIGETINSVDVSKWVYAVPYGNTLEEFQGGTARGTIKRIEYPKEGMPANTVKVGSTAGTDVTNGAIAGGTGAGIFIPKKIVDLKAGGVADPNMLSLDVSAQQVKAKTETSPNYFDFQLSADGLPILVPAYLDLDGSSTQQMDLSITSRQGRLRPTQEEAIASPATGNEDITIAASYSRIGEDWTLERLEGGSFKDYRPKQHVSPNEASKKGFTLMENGLYRIVATASAINGPEKATVYRYIKLQDRALVIEGKHLEDGTSERWTNLADSGITSGGISSGSALEPFLPRLGAGASSVDNIKIEPVTIAAFDTTIERNGVKKEAIEYKVKEKESRQERSAPSHWKSFVLYETGRYVISAKGVGMEQEQVKYINVDVDRPQAPALRLTSGGILLTGGAVQSGIDYEVVLPEENPVQSPIHYAYRIDGTTGGAFTSAASKTIRLAATNSKLELVTVDAATNQSEIAVYSTGVAPTRPPSGGGGGKHVKPELVINEDVISIGYIFGYKDGTFGPNKNLTRAEFAAMMDRLLILPEPPSSSVPFTDVSSTMWAQGNIRRLAEAKIIYGTGKQKFDPNRTITREEFAAILCRALGLDSYNASSALTDISKSFAEKEIAKACNAGIISGYSDNTFRPKQYITRAEAVILLNKVFLETNAREKKNIFSDVPKNCWFEKDVLKAIVEE